LKTEKISDAVVRRLPVYLRYLKELTANGVTTVSSQELGEKLNLNPAQIRKDLAYFGEFGRKGIGYDVEYLVEKIRQILKLNQVIHVGLAGAGNLGRALCNYNAFAKDNMKIVAVLETVRRLNIRVGIITVPASEAQSVANQFVDAGIEAILNFAPAILKVPDHVRIHHADFTIDLQSLAYFLDN